MSNRPSAYELLHGVLSFLAEEGSDQVREIHEYLSDCQSDPLNRAHVWNPFAEILEGVVKISLPEKNELPKDVSERLEEIECMIELLSNKTNGYGSVTDDEIINGPEWRIVRRLSRDTLVAIGEGNMEKLTVFTLLCYIAD